MTADALMLVTLVVSCADTIFIKVTEGFVIISERVRVVSSAARDTPLWALAQTLRGRNDAGAGILSLTQQTTVPAAVIPLPLPSSEDSASPKHAASDTAQTLEYCYASSSELVKLRYRYAPTCSKSYRDTLELLAWKMLVSWYLGRT